MAKLLGPLRDETRLADASVVLRPYSDADVGPSYEAIRESIEELMPWMPWCYPEYSLEDSAAWIAGGPKEWEHGAAYEFAIADAAGGGLLGGCGLNHVDLRDGRANLGYWVRSNRTRRGVATAAALLVARFGIRELGLKRIEIVVAVGNEPSLRVAEKAGATREEVLRNRIVVGDKALDAVMFSLTPQDFEEA